MRWFALLDQVPSQTAEPFHRGLRIAVLVIAATVLLSLSMFRSLQVYRPLWLQIVAFVILASILTTETVLVVRSRTWGQRRWWGIGAVMTAEVAAYASLPGVSVTTAADWMFGTAGWFGLILLLDMPLLWMVGFLAGHEAVVVAVVMCSDATDSGLSLNLAVGSLGAIGYPMASGVAAAAVRSIAVRAERAVRAAGDIRTAEAVAARLYEQRQRRLADLRESVVPLLQGLADGVLNPDDIDVQRVCAIEAARLRRLFAETDDVADPLLHVLAECVERVERQGVVVDWQNQGSWPTPPLEIQRTLTDGPLAALVTADSCARVAVVCAAGELSVSVVADSGHVSIGLPANSSVEVTTMLQDRMLWVEARWAIS
jgi:hypothetical protein